MEIVSSLISFYEEAIQLQSFEVTKLKHICRRSKDVAMGNKRRIVVNLVN